MTKRLAAKVLIWPIAIIIITLWWVWRLLSLLWLIIWSWLALKVMWALSVTGRYKALIAFGMWLGWGDEEKTTKAELDDFEKAISEQDLVDRWG